VIKIEEKKYPIKYTCGCVHEIKIEQGQHEPTGKQDQCEIHKSNGEVN